MRINFIGDSQIGHVKYDPSTETYSWSYDGDDQEVIDLLSICENGKHFSEIVVEEHNPEHEERIVMNERYELMPWKGQIKYIGKLLRQMGFETHYEE